MSWSVISTVLSWVCNSLSACWARLLLPTADACWKLVWMASIRKMSNSNTRAAVEELACKKRTTAVRQVLSGFKVKTSTIQRTKIFSHHLDEQVLSAALDVFTHAALLGLVIVTAFAITDGDFSFVCGWGALVTDGALWHAQLALKGRGLLHGGAHSTAGTSFY